MKTLYLIFLSALCILTGCSSTGVGQRVAIDSLATAGGGAAAYFAGDRDPALTTAGAVGGFVVSEAFQSMARSGREKAYRSGIKEGKALGQEQILKGLWEESNGLPKQRYGYQNLNPKVPARIQNGVVYDAHIAPASAVQPEKILISPSASTNNPFHPHYETFQKQK